MPSKIKVAAVSYLNTKPLLYGLENDPIIDEIDLTIEYPSKIAAQLQSNAIDVGLVPVAAIPTIPNATIISNYGIAADGPVASVSLYSAVPMQEIEAVFLDYQSRTSVKLAQLLLMNYWKQPVHLLPAPEDYMDRIKGTTAGVIIGDRALIRNNAFPFVYDLAEAWKAYTGLPFIFAAWVANKALPQPFISQFERANGEGLRHLDEVIAAHPFSAYDLHTYYRKNIHFQFTASHRAGLEKFLKMLASPTHITTG